MSYVTRLLLVLTSSSIKKEIRQQIERLWKDQREALEQMVLKFMLTEISPATMFDFEKQIAEWVREFARQLVEQVLNRWKRKIRSRCRTIWNIRPAATGG